MRASRKKRVMIALVGISLISLAFLFSGCGGDDGDTYIVPPSDPCAGGPVPCLTQDWGMNYYEFTDQWGDPVVVVSDGAIAVGAGVADYQGTGQIVIIAVEGPVIDCYNADFDYAYVDFDLDRIIDYETADVVGKGNICFTMLKVTSLIIDGYAYPDIVATYAGGPYPLSMDVRDALEQLQRILPKE